VTNYGTIAGGAVTTSGTSGNGVALSGGVLVNFGTIRNGDAGSATAGVGVLATGAAATFQNGGAEGNGTISGGVTLGNFANQVTLHAGSAITGHLNIGTSTSATLALAALGSGSQLYSNAVTGATTFSGLLVKEGTGTWTLDAALAPAAVALNAGTLVLGHANAIGSAGTISFGGGTLRSSASNSTDYSARFSNAASQQYAVDTNGQSVTFAAALSSAGGSFTKLGAGTLTLSGANAYTGTTTVSAGSFQVGSSGVGQTGTGAVTVQTGSTLLGTGVVQGTTFTADNGSTIRPGDSAADSSHGTLTFSPADASGSTVSLQGSISLGISTPTTTDATFGGHAFGSAGYQAWVDAAAGAGGHDRLVFNNPDSGSGYNLDFLTTTGSLQVVGVDFTPAKGQVFNLLDWGSRVTPNFTGFSFNKVGGLTGNGDEGAGLDLPDITASGLRWDVSRLAISGAVAVVPEPASALLFLAGLVGLVTRRCRV